MISISDPRLALNVLRDIELFPKYNLVNKFQIEYFGGDSIGIANSKRWEELHAIFYPLVKDTKVYFDVMNEESLKHVMGLEVGKEYHIFKEISSVTLRILGECIFGADFSNDEFEGRRPLDSFQYVMKNLSNDMAMLFPWICYLPTKGNRELSASIRHIRKYMAYLVEEGKKHYDPNVGAHSLVQLLIREKALDKMSKDSVVDNAIMFLSGGHETTTVTLALTIYLIGKHPDIQKRVHEEVDAFLAKGELDFATAKKDLKLLFACVKECVRLYPPIAMLVPRTAKEDTKLGNIFVPKGTNIQLNAWKMHYDEKNYPNPTAFVPERWYNRDLRESNINKIGFFGFAEGKRTCTGKEFSQYESAIYLVNLFKLYKVVVPEDSKVKFIKDSILLIPDNNLKVIFKARK